MQISFAEKEMFDVRGLSSSGDTSKTGYLTAISRVY
jgi:hypothetical protein